MKLGHTYYALRHPDGRRYLDSSYRWGEMGRAVILPTFDDAIGVMAAVRMSGEMADVVEVHCLFPERPTNARLPSLGPGQPAADPGASPG